VVGWSLALWIARVTLPIAPSEMIGRVSDLPDPGSTDPDHDRLAGGPGNDACLQASGTGLRISCERPTIEAPAPVLKASARPPRVGRERPGPLRDVALAFVCNGDVTRRDGATADRRAVHLGISGSLMGQPGNGKVSRT